MKPFRRSLAIVLFMILLSMSPVGLLIHTINHTLVSPQFYKDQFNRDQIYDFLSIELPQVVLLEFFDQPSGQAENSFWKDRYNISISNDDMSEAIGAVVDADWLQYKTENALDEIVGYLNGHSDVFEIRLDIHDRIELVGGRTKLLIRKARIQEYFLSELKQLANDKMYTGDLAHESFGITSDDITASLERIVEEQWFYERLDLLIDLVVAYTLGDQESFTAVFDLSDRKELIVQETTQLLVESKFTESIIEAGLYSRLLEYSSQLYGFSSETLYTDEEITDIAVELSGHHSFYDQEKDFIRGFLESLFVNQHQSEEFTAPLNIPIETVSLVMRDTLQSRPDSLGPLTAYTEGRISSLAKLMLADEIRYTESYLRQIISDIENSSVLDTLDWLTLVINNKWVYTSTDLEHFVSTLNQGMSWSDIRNLADPDWHYTDKELLEDVYAIGGQQFVHYIDTIRSQLSRMRNVEGVLYFVLIFLPLAIGVLWGDGLRHKIIWAIGSISGSMLVVTVLSWPMYDFLVDVAIGDLNGYLSRYSSGIQLYAVGWMSNVLEGLAYGFIQPIRNFSLILLILSSSSALIAMHWQTIVGSITHRSDIQ